MKKVKRERNNQMSLFKKDAPRMPEGYYSGDKPNPNLRAFVEQHIKEKPYDSETDDYDVPAFDKPIETTKATAIYNMHTYWSKKPHDAIRQYIRHYTKPGDLVLDPFCGSGGTALAALMEGRKAIAIDRSPAATFITKNYCTPVDVDKLQQDFEELRCNIKPEIDWLYETRCDRCGGISTTVYTVYSQVFQCPRCLKQIPLFDCVKTDGRTAKGRAKKISACPHCHTKGIVEEISTRSQRFGAVPVMVNYLCENGCKPARDRRRYNDKEKIKREYFNKYDLGKINEIAAKKIPYEYPDAELKEVIPYRMLYKKDFRPSEAQRLIDLYTKRNLWALAAVRHAIKSDNHLLLAFSAVLLNSSKLYRHRLGGGGGTTGNYYIGQQHREMAVWPQIAEKVDEYLKANWYFNPQMIISTQSAVNQQEIPAGSVDYIFTDPPYAGKVQYGELNFVWEAWLGLDTHWYEDEIIINEIRGKTEKDWTDMMRQTMAECFRVLKPGRWISLCYHDTSEGTWALIQDIMAEVGFLVERSDAALYIDTQQKSYNQIVADKVNRRDLVVNFRKPLADELMGKVVITGEEDDSTFNEKVRWIICDHLVSNPGSTKDRIYDEVVSRMIRAGRMEPHDFDSLLRQVADEVVTPVMKNLFEQQDPDLFGGHEKRRWYLKENELVEQDEAETLKEDKAGQIIYKFIQDFLIKNPENEGVHYGDLFEHYVYRVKDKPRRQLAEFLPDYFFKTESGTWRLPASEDEERLKAEGRTKGTLRRIKRYLSFIDHNLPVPEKERPNDATIAEWIRHCKRSGLYEQGKLLYEKGGLNLENLSETDQVYAEEDYGTCVRYLNRGL